MTEDLFGRSFGSRHRAGRRWPDEGRDAWPQRVRDERQLDCFAGGELGYARHERREEARQAAAEREARARESDDERRAVLARVQAVDPALLAFVASMRRHEPSAPRAARTRLVHYAVEGEVLIETPTGRAVLAGKATAVVPVAGAGWKPPVGRCDGWPWG